VKPTVREVNRCIKASAFEDWNDLGLALEVGDSNGDLLDQIAERNNHNKRDCFTEMIKTWIKSADNVTWQRLLECLREVGNQEAAQNVEIW